MIDEDIAEIAAQISEDIDATVVKAKTYQPQCEKEVREDDEDWEGTMAEVEKLGKELPPPTVRHSPRSWYPSGTPDGRQINNDQAQTRLRQALMEARAYEMSQQQYQSPTTKRPVVINMRAGKPNVSPASPSPLNDNLGNRKLDI